MSVYYVVFGDTSDSALASTGANAFDANLGALATRDASATTAVIGAVSNDPPYDFRQADLGFDTSAVPAGGAATLGLNVTAVSASSGTLTIRQFAWSGATSDWRTESQQSGDTSLASFTRPAAAGFLGVALGSYSSTNLWKLYGHGGQDGTNSGNITVNTADASGTTSDPRVTVIVGTGWQFVGVSNVVEVTGTSHALVTTGISGLQTGDLLIACISSRIASTTSITLPVGGEWTLVSEQKNNNTATNTSATPSGMMAYCVRGASDPNLTFTHPTSPSVAIGRIVAYRNVDTGSPKDTQTSFTTATNTTAVSGTGLTTTQDDDLIVAMAAGGQEASWTAFAAATDPTTSSGTGSSVTSNPAPNAWLERADSNTVTGADTSLGIFDAVKTAAGATGNLTCTASQGAAHVVVAGAFKLVASGGGGGAEKPADHFVDKDFTNSLFVRPRFLLGPRV